MASLAKRLTARFGDALGREVVEEVVRRHAGSLADTRTVDFVPLFVERLALPELSARQIAEAAPKEE